VKHGEEKRGNRGARDSVGHRADQSGRTVAIAGVGNFAVKGAFAEAVQGIEGCLTAERHAAFSTDWFITWQPNIHSSLFINIHKYLIEYAKSPAIEAVMKAYKLYLEQAGQVAEGDEAVLSLTRAWTLVRFFESKMLATTPCSKCSGHFVVHRLDLHQDYLCGLCHMPSRAGKTKKPRMQSRCRCAKQWQWKPLPDFFFMYCGSARI